MKSMSDQNPTAQVIPLPVFRNVPDEVLLDAFDAWDGVSDVDVPGAKCGEDVYWELNRRGIAPPI
jgi:hypothetical protein